MARICCFFLLITLLISCKSKDYLTPYEYEGRVIDFGSGGGFTGKVTCFTLMDNGQIFEGTNLEGNVSALKKIDRRAAQQVFDNYDRLKLNDMDVDTPGNLYQYITMKDGANTHKLTWGGKDEVTKELNLFYAILMKHVNKKTADTAKGIQVK